VEASPPLEELVTAGAIPASRDAADVFDPWSSAFVADPYPAYARLRDEAPVQFFEPTGQYLISRYDDVNALLRDRRLGRAYLHRFTHAEFGQPEDPPHLDPFWRLVRTGMLDVEPPDHTRLRRLVSKAFTPRMVEELKPRVQAITATLVDDLLDAGSDGSAVDLKSLVAEPLPVTVIAEMLGVPEPDRHLLRPWSADICGMYELNPTREAQDTAVRASVEFSDYLRELARARRVDPQDDLVSALAQVMDEGDRLTEDELIGTCVLLLNAGHEATVNVTTNGWGALFRNPDQLELLRSDLSLLPGALEELMRYDTPLQMFERWVLEDIEVHGVHIPRGVEVALLFGSANHDPAKFADPARLDLTRAENPHITFGAGIHFCLGAPLARVELQASYGEILRRVPRLALAAEPQWGPGYIIRGLESLPVTVR
jgi:cytochrome P450